MRFVLSSLLLVASLVGVACQATPVHIREPAVAGSFYPGTGAELRSMIEGFLAAAGPAPEAPGDLLALISPHAGYAYSGGVAAYSYRELEGKKIHTVIVMGPSHRISFQGVSVYAEGAFRTPLGDVRINEELARRLINKEAGVVYAREPHAQEHSIETQVPFLQVVLPDQFRIVPIALGMPSPDSFRHLTEEIADILARDKGVFLVASTDLSHYFDYRTALEMDTRTIEPIRSVSLEKLEHLLKTGTGQMCGGWPVVYTLGVVRKLGATEGILYRYANSGDVTGDRTKVVGYAAMGLYRSAFTAEERAFLHDAAVRTVRQYVGRGTIPEIATDNPKLNSHHGVFVTINRHGRLRGCIGSMAPVRPLIEGVVQNAVAAASADPRFPPMTFAELDDIDVEVSVLSPFRPLDNSNVGDVVIGRDGLYLRKDEHSGVFLPQVPVEQGWDLETYLGQLCRKAHITDASCWKDRDTRLYTFTAEVFGGH